MKNKLLNKILIFQERLEVEKKWNIKKHEEKEIEVRNLQNKIREAEESKNARVVINI